MPVTTFIWDHQRYLAEADDSNVINVVYSCEPQGFGNLVTSRLSTSTYYHHFDATHSTRQLTAAAGAITDTWLLDAYGQLISRNGTTNTRMEWGGELLYYNDTPQPPFLFYIRRRTYAPSVARWTSSDPAGFNLLGTGPNGMADGRQSLNNVYAYAHCSPVLLTDPSGLSPSLCSAEYCTSSGPHSSFSEGFLYLSAQVDAGQSVELRCGKDDIRIKFRLVNSTYLGPGNVASRGGGPCGQPAQEELTAIFGNDLSFTYGKITERGCTKPKFSKMKDSHGCWLLEWNWSCEVGCENGGCGQTNPKLGIYGPKDLRDRDSEPHWGISNFSIQTEAMITYREPCSCLLNGCDISLQIDWQDYVPSVINPIPPHEPIRKRIPTENNCSEADKKRLSS